MKRKIAGILSLAMLLGMLAACSSNSAPEDTAQPPEQSSTEASEPETTGNDSEEADAGEWSVAGMPENEMVAH